MCSMFVMVRRLSRDVDMCVACLQWLGDLVEMWICGSMFVIVGRLRGDVDMCVACL